eukprot:gnl/TRDRNA2_/TRDRNA2_153899_c0_seq1.p1 gnl/TRDRNA2_/TRDRNA2_153899_c0~~gnl/TRDRNA2_/TRDRNA2_153899_c0_seq1.p1  ORF type:complete len:443 (+),score=72.31 gnl/TRDRNA2_/TRDRNA2_153899_c0_seq1:86-1330(+)
MYKRARSPTDAAACCPPRKLRKDARASRESQQEEQELLCSPFGRPHPGKVAELVDTNSDGQITRDELQFFGDILRMSGRNADSRQMQKLVDAAPLTHEKFAQWLDESDTCEQLNVQAMIWLRNKKDSLSWTWRLKWPFRKVRYFYVMARLKIDPAGYQKQLRDAHHRELLKEQLKTVQERTREVEQKARARSIPERPTDFAMQVGHPEDQWPTLEVSISYEDTLDDVFARYVDRLKRLTAKPGESEDKLYKAENQPDWLVVQQGGERNKEGFALRNLGIPVSALEITAADTLLFMSPTTTFHNIFFKAYSRSEALKAAPTSPAKKAWDTWMQDHVDDYKQLQNPDKVKVYFIEFARKGEFSSNLRFLCRCRTMTLDSIEERSDEHVHYVVNGLTFCRDSKGRASYPPMCGRGGL